MTAELQYLLLLGRITTEGDQVQDGKVLHTLTDPEAAMLLTLQGIPCTSDDVSDWRDLLTSVPLNGEPTAQEQPVQNAWDRQCHVTNRLQPAWQTAPELFNLNH